MSTSLNGWPVLQPGSKQLATGLVPGTTRKLTMRREVLPLFLALAHDYDDWIAPIDIGPIDDAGYAYRYARTGAGWSNHSSGTAADLNWSKEGAQRATNRTFWGRPKIAQSIDQIKAVYHVVDWGGDWSTQYWDPMHWEIRRNVTLAEVAARIKYLGITSKGVRHKDLNGHELATART